MKFVQWMIYDYIYSFLVNPQDLVTLFNILNYNDPAKQTTCET